MRRWEYPIAIDQHGLAVPGVSFDALVATTDFDVEDVEDTDTVWPVLLPALRNRSTDEWREIVQRLDPDNLHSFAELLKEHAGEAAHAMGNAKYATIRGEVFLRRLSHPDARWRLSREIDLEQARLRYIRKDWRERNPLKPPIPYAKLAEVFGVTDKTLKRWERMGAM